MESSGQVHPVGSSDVQVEVVTADGHPVTSRPIRIEELLQQKDKTLDVGEGIALRLEELNAEQQYSDDDDDEEEGDDEGESDRDAGSSDDSSLDASAINGTDGRPATRTGGRPGAAAAAAASPPPGTHATNEWYDVLDALRREQRDVEKTAAALEQSRRQPREGEGRLVTRNPNSHLSVATPLKRFSPAASQETKSIADDRSATPAAPPPGASRHEVWASLAPPRDRRHPHNYQVLRYVSYMSALDYRRFRPTALAFHAAACYLNRKDRGQRFLVYGGFSAGCRKVEQELYEFSVLTGNWRRMEGRQLVPAGHYAHTMTVVEPLDRLVVVGGIGPGGAAVSREMRQAWAADAMRAPRYNLLCPLMRRGTRLGAGGGSGVVAATQSNPVPLGIGAPLRHGAPQAAATIGFVSLLFDMNLSDLSWRAIQPAQPFPIAYHTAVHFNKQIYIFGGLTDELRVSGQLLAIDAETYAVRLVTVDGKRRSGSSSGRSGSSAAAAASAGSDDEAAGPGPRFLHTAVRYGPYMIVFGGLNAHNEVIGDCWAFDMVNERWERLRCRGQVAGRAGHECCVVGCRLLVVGGFEGSLEEMSAAATGTPATSVMELNLVPTTTGEHLWRAAVKLHPALPPLAFTRCVPCGEDHSFLLFGGLTQLPRRVRSASAARRENNAHSDGGSDEGSDGESDDGGSPRGRGGSVAEQQGEEGEAKAAKAAGPHKGLLSRLTPLDDGLVFTFPLKQRHKKHDPDAPVVNALGVEVDPNELPEHFKTFVRRQEDFIKKKDASAADVMRKTTLEEQEGMEPTLYLTEDEIELLLSRSEECCTAFAQRYPMASLPSNVPDRDERVRLIEECISESRQVRDVLKSMKGSAPGVTAVKSKTHRKRAGQKFEDYSAAKPFRRVVVMHLLDSINSHLARMHRLNKALRTVDWEEKTGFLEAIDDMQDSVHGVTRAVNAVMRKYIQHRVDSLMKGVDKHKEVMRLLTQVVEKNRHDKIWGVEEARDEKRAQSQRAKSAAGKATATAAAGQSRGASASGKAAGRSGSHKRSGTTRSPVHRSRSLGGGYHADESKAVVYVMDKEWSELLSRTQAVERCATQLQRYCLDGMTGGAAGAAGGATAAASDPPAAPVMPLAVGSGPLSLPLPHAGFAAAPPALAPPPQSGLPLPAPLTVPVAPGSASGFALPPPSVSVLAPSLPAEPPAEAGAARPRDVLIRHSNELRGKTAAVAAEVAAAAAAFFTTLTAEPAGGAAGPPSASASSTSLNGAPAAQQSGVAPAAAPVAALPAPQLVVPSLATPTPQPEQTPSSSRSTSASTSASTSRSSSSGPAAPAMMPAVPAVGLPVPVTAAVTEAVAPPPAQQPAAVSGGEPAAAAAEKKPSKTSSAAAVPASPPPTGHALLLSWLRPLLAAKETLRTVKDKVALIRKNEWDGNDLAGAPQDTKVEELYKRLDRYITAVGQCVTANFLTKAGARPPRARPTSTSVVAPPRATSSKTKSSAARHSAKVAQPPSVGGAGKRKQHASPSSTSMGGQAGSPTPQPTDTAVGAQDGPAAPLRLKPLPASAAADGNGVWWPSPHPSSGGTAEAAAPLVPAETLLENVRLDDLYTAAAAAGAPAAMTVEPVYHSVQKVPNSSLAATGAGSRPATYAHAVGDLSNPWRPAPKGVAQAPGYVPASSVAGGTAQPAASLISLSVVPKVVMPTASDAVESSDRAGRRGSSGGTALQQQRRRSTIQELTQLAPQTPAAAAAVVEGSELASGLAPAAREPITSITGGNFAVNTEYLYRVAPQTIPVTATAAGDPASSADPFSAGAGQHSWADVDDDYFYFGRPVEKRIAPTETVVSGPPYVSAPPPLSAAGTVTVSPPIGSVVGSQRVNAELAVSARTPSARRRSASGRRDGAGYQSTTASQVRKSQTARPVRKDGDGAKRFYTPGELQLMQARERLRQKPAKH